MYVRYASIAGFPVRPTSVLLNLLMAVVAMPSIHAAEAEVKIVKAKCDLAEYRQFDFWIGEWRVVETKTGDAAGARWLGFPGGISDLRYPDTETRTLEELRHCGYCQLAVP